MMSRSNAKPFTLTESAAKEYDAMLSDLVRQVDAYLKDTYRVPGENEIEITASDIHTFRTRLRLVRSSHAAIRLAMIKTIAATYALFGIMMTAGSLVFSGYVSEGTSGITALAGTLGLALGVAAAVLYVSIDRRQAMYRSATALPRHHPDGADGDMFKEHMERILEAMRALEEAQKSHDTTGH